MTNCKTKSVVRAYLKSFLRRRRNAKVARRGTSGHRSSNDCALKGRNNSSAAPPAQKIFFNLFQTFHVWLPSCCRFAAKTQFSKYILRFIIIVFLVSQISFALRQTLAQSGVLSALFQGDKSDKILSLQVMNVDVLIDNQHARVRVLQIYDNLVSDVLEGHYMFALPQQSLVSDFAVWDGDTRIPGVIIEKRRANKIYGEIKQREVDPGLLQQDDEQGGTSAFSARVFPIPSYGSKRIELEYSEMLPIEGLSSHFTFPLKPSFGAPQKVGEFNLHVKILNDYPIGKPENVSYPMTVIKSDANDYEAEFKATNIELKEDFSLDYKIAVNESALSFITYRAPEQITAYDLRDPALAAKNPDGYFASTAIFNESSTSYDLAKQSRNIVLLMDTSLSMYGEKLTRAVEAVDFFLHNLTPQDRFNLVLFNEDSNAFSQEPLAATPENIERAMSFIKTSTIGGGTNLRQVFNQAIKIATKSDLIIVSDANPTLGTTDAKQILSAFDNQSIKVFALALGSDANKSLLEELATRTHGYYEQARETEDISASLKIFFDKVGTPSIEGLRFSSSNANNLYQIYQTRNYSFDGSGVEFVGRYRQPQLQIKVSVQGQYGPQNINLARQVLLPEFEDTHAHLPRLWAKARVDFLLHEMDINGEREDYISEIIRLSQKYKFVTPYTAFLAAPRSLLRPRLIQPGDPVIRVKTDESIKSVFAVLPFGETLPLKFLESEKVWEVRFLAPAWMPDGVYRCRLLLTDKDGNGYQEEKTFVIDSHAPRLQIAVDSKTVKAGDEIKVRVNADSDTMRLVAKFYGAKPVHILWDGKEKVCVGKIRVPVGLASGKYILTVTAEDFAHNQSSVEVEVEIL
jgi:Ca-activated chloride channel family protein